MMDEQFSSGSVVEFTRENDEEALNACKWEGYK
jgi:hypothetical protein